MDETGKKLLRRIYCKVLWVGLWQTKREIGTETERHKERWTSRERQKERQVGR